MEVFIRIELLSRVQLPLKPQLEWLWYSQQSRSFIAGDGDVALALPISKLDSPIRLESPTAEYSATHSCNLPVTDTLYEEFIKHSWHGFHFLEKRAYDLARDKDGHAVGDLLRTLVFGPDYGNYVLHPASGAVLALRSGRMDLLKQSANGFEVLDSTKTRGKAALAFAAHPHETLIAYGDNFGTFHAHRFDAAKFGKASKIATKERKASRLEFVSDGLLAIGGMGYLSTLKYKGQSFAPLHEISTSVRDFIVTNQGTRFWVNQGMHGVTAYQYDAAGFEKLASIDAGGAVQQLAISNCGKYLAMLLQDSPTFLPYSIEQ